MKKSIPEINIKHLMYSEINKGKSKNKSWEERLNRDSSLVDKVQKPIKFEVIKELRELDE
jgi:hypothetical protein